MRHPYIDHDSGEEVEPSKLTWSNILGVLCGFILGCSLVWSSHHPKRPPDVAAASYINTVCHLAYDTAKINSMFDEDGLQHIARVLHALSSVHQDRACVALRDDIIATKIYQWRIRPLGVLQLSRFNIITQAIKDPKFKKD